MIQHRSLCVVYASTNGHTEYVVDALIDSLHSTAADWQIEEKAAEKAQPWDLLRGDILMVDRLTTYGYVLGSGRPGPRWIRRRRGVP